MADARWTCSVVALVIALCGVARAETLADASLRAVKDRVIRLELADGAPAVQGRLLAFEDGSVTIALASTNEVVTLPRAKVVRVIVVETSPVEAVKAVALDGPPGPEKWRVVGVHSSLLGTVAVDVDYKHFRAFASTSLLLPVMTAAEGNRLWLTAAAGAGVTVPLGTTSRWKLDVFGQVLPLHTTSFYTYLGFGVGAGFHYTAASGLSVGFSFPVIGFSTRLGSSPYGYDAAFRYNDSLAYYYLAGAAGMPIVTLGYRFASNCPPPD